VLWGAPDRTNSLVYPEDWLNAAEEIHVDDGFRVQGTCDAFAFGDVCSLAETRQAITLSRKLPTVLKNVRTTAKAFRLGTPLEKVKLKAYKPASSLQMYLPFGPDQGVSQVKSGKVYGDAKTSKAKGKDLFTEYFYRLLTNLDPPIRAINQ